MNDDNQNAQGLNRRDFIRLGSTGAVGAALTGVAALNASAQQAAPAAVPSTAQPPATNQAAGQAPAVTADQAAAQITGKLPTRPYGKTGLQIGCIVGASDWGKDVIPLAVQSGVNYWHKANYWGKVGYYQQRWGYGMMPDAIMSQPRESYFLECVVDRDGRDKDHPVGNEKMFYDTVKEAIANNPGIGYYDVLKFHYGYWSIDEAKADTGIIDAFQRLKKEGLVRHLAISQHHYSPGPRSPGGQSAYEILPWLMDNMPYEAAQFFYSYSGDSGRGASPHDKVEALLALCKQKGFGTIAMKTMSGVGRFLAQKSRAPEQKIFNDLLADPKYTGSTPGSAIVKWLMNNPNLDAATINIVNFDQLGENMKAAINPAMTEADHHMLNLITAFNKGTTCLLCADCATSCPEEIAIIDILRYERYAMDYHDLERAKHEYKALSKNGTSCLACGDCIATPACSNDINVMAKLKEVHNLLS